MLLQISHWNFVTFKKPEFLRNCITKRMLVEGVYKFIAGIKQIMLQITGLRHTAGICRGINTNA